MHHFKIVNSFFPETVFGPTIALFWFAPAFLFITAAAALPDCHKFLL
jgi:hypothetical protein